MPKDFPGGTCTDCGKLNKSPKFHAREEKKADRKAASFVSVFAEHLKDAGYPEVKRGLGMS